MKINLDEVYRLLKDFNEELEDLNNGSDEAAANADVAKAQAELAGQGNRLQMDRRKHKPCPRPVRLCRNTCICRKWCKPLADRQPTTHTGTVFRSILCNTVLLFRGTQRKEGVRKGLKKSNFNPLKIVIKL